MVDPRTASHETVAAERLRINLSWFVKLRWAGAVGQLATIGISRAWFDVPLPMGPLLGIVAVGALTNAGLELWQRWARSGLDAKGWVATGRALIGTVTLVDVALLSGLLYFTGGASNPFAVFYFVNLVLAMVVLGGLWMRALNAAALLAFALLLFFHEPLAIGGPELFQIDGGSRFLTPYAKGLLVAFAAVVAFTAYFVRRLSDELTAREAELERERARKADSDRVQALATLAAGAAHELSSPLSTIAVVARELERVLERGGAESAAIDDARLIRTEVTRCRSILDQMSLEAGGPVGEELVTLAPEELVENALRALRERARVRVTIDRAAATARLTVPRVATARALRALIKNALEATADGSDVAVAVEPAGPADAQLVRFSVADTGSGMDEEVLARAGDPFFTTKDPGRGMGLGLFLARTLAERLGGRLQLNSGVERGTVAVFELPVTAAARAGEPGAG